MQIDVYSTATNYITYFEKKTGASMTLGRYLSEYTSGSVSLFAEELNYKDPAPGICPDLFPLVCSQLGNQSTTGSVPRWLATRETTIWIPAAVGEPLWVSTWGRPTWAEQ